MKKIAAPIPRCALSVPEAAASLSLGVDAFQASVQPHLRVVRVGRRVLVPVAELEQWVAANSEAPMVDQVGR